MVCTSNYPNVLAFCFLDELQREFIVTYDRKRISSALRPYSFIEFGEFLAGQRSPPGSAMSPLKFILHFNLSPTRHLHPEDQAALQQPPFPVHQNQPGWHADGDQAAAALPAVPWGPAGRQRLLGARSLQVQGLRCEMTSRHLASACVCCWISDVPSLPCSSQPDAGARVPPRHRLLRAERALWRPQPAAGRARHRERAAGTADSSMSSFLHLHWFDWRLVFDMTGAERATLFPQNDEEDFNYVIAFFLGTAACLYQVSDCLRWGRPAAAWLTALHSAACQLD